jgi:hypothetical protein
VDEVIQAKTREQLVSEDAVIMWAIEIMCNTFKEH